MAVSYTSTTIIAKKSDLYKDLGRAIVHKTVFTMKLPIFLYSIEDTPNDHELLLLAIKRLHHMSFQDVNTATIGLIAMRALGHLENDTVAVQVRCEHKIVYFFKNNQWLFSFFWAALRKAICIKAL